ncbi:MAG: twin-arginine translocation pathway signal sequence domain-containing protein [Micavibrio sp.]|nr:twin-arginine translocation pathway signal sequence domain-containing protein [Micavibrio sp.]|tara:strand:- start:1129 stop:1707 length:579 start_codon:yes stop_codon:yes gene_type:complete
MTIFNRRNFLKQSLFLGAGLVTSLSAAKAEAFNLPAQQLFQNVKEPKTISFKCLHTGEVFNGAYKVGDQYIKDSLRHLRYVLRDHRDGTTHDIDRDLLDYMHAVKMRANRDQDFVVLSGFRSHKTNAMLRRTTTGVAKNSFHMEGRAIDIRIPGYSVAELQKNAHQLKLGGVGYYPKSGFVHIDTGPIRDWS